jgi:phosphoenolpyruvate carboxylase
MASNKPKPLWKADDQQARLAEVIATSDEPAKDHPLRRDVRSLGAILGQVLVEQSGQDLFDSVEELRRLMIEHRETVRRSPEQSSSPELMLKAQETVSRMDLPRAYQVTKAFATYFELTNLAETNHRQRRRRAGKLDREHAPLPGSFRGTLLRMKEAGISAEDAASDRGRPPDRSAEAPPHRKATGTSRPPSAHGGRGGRLRKQYPRGSHLPLADRRSPHGEAHSG